MTEKLIRYTALIVCLVLFFSFEGVRHYLVWAVTAIVLVWCTIVLAACVVMPEEVAQWLREKWGD